MAHRLAPEAEADVDDLRYYVATNASIDTADRLVESITMRFFLLGTHPRAGRRREDLRPGLRSFAVGEYVIVYRIDGDDVRILRVIEAAGISNRSCVSDASDLEDLLSGHRTRTSGIV
jgi:toxin ParE1/3/4